MPEITPDTSANADSTAEPSPTIAVQAGWYPTPDGEQRYWDGSAWTNLLWNGDVMARPALAQTRKRRRALIIAVAGVVVVAGLVVGGLAIKSNIDSHNAQVAAAAHAAAVKKKAADAAEVKQEKDDAERAARKAAIPGIQDSVKDMATKDVGTGVIDGPILGVSCSPVGGGSTDDLTEQTTVFQCFVSNKDNADGTQTGYYFNATMNWSTGEYTYGFGKP